MAIQPQKREIWTVQHPNSGNILTHLVVGDGAPEDCDEVSYGVVPLTEWATGSEYDIRYRIEDEGDHRRFLITRFWVAQESCFIDRVNIVSEEEMLPVEDAFRKWLGL